MLRSLAMVMLVGVSLSSCDNSDQKLRHVQIIAGQKGRFAIIPASGRFPPLILDTTSGCTVAIREIGDEQNGYDLQLDELSYSGGTSSCNAGKQLLVIDTLSEIGKN